MAKRLIKGDKGDLIDIQNTIQDLNLEGFFSVGTKMTKKGLRIQGDEDALVYVVQDLDDFYDNIEVV